jgi:hypothetical protein
VCVQRVQAEINRKQVAAEKLQVVERAYSDMCIRAQHTSSIKIPQYTAILAQANASMQTAREAVASNPANILDLVHTAQQHVALVEALVSSEELRRKRFEEAMVRCNLCFGLPLAYFTIHVLHECAGEFTVAPR